MIMDFKKNLKKFIHKLDLKFLNKIFFDNGIIKLFARYLLPRSKKSIVGWIPYLKNRTKVVIFNFFSINYSIRENIEGRIYLVQNQEIIDQYNFDLNLNEIKEFCPNDLFRDKNGDTIIVELISDKIKNNHGGHDGHLRFWGKYEDDKNNIRAISHSMPLSYNDLFTKISDKYSRNYNLKLNNKERMVNFYPGGYIEKEKYGKNSVYGFNMIIEDQEPKSIWHLSPLNKNNIECELTQGFYCPKSSKVDPIIILDPNETGIQDNEVNFFILTNNQIKFVKKEIIKGLFIEKVSSIFQKIEDEYYFFIKFKSLGDSHAHVHYSNENDTLDQVHMHGSNWEFKDNKLSFKESIKTRNCRKFFCYDLKDSNLENYIIIHNEKLKDKISNNLKIRIFQNGNENLINYDFPPEKPIKVINVKDVFKDAKSKNTLVQIESNDYNFHATGLIFNKVTENITTDHFTGG